MCKHKYLYKGAIAKDFTLSSVGKVIDFHLHTYPTTYIIYSYESLLFRLYFGFMSRFFLLIFYRFLSLHFMNEFYPILSYHQLI